MKNEIYFSQQNVLTIRTDSVNKFSRKAESAVFVKSAVFSEINELRERVNQRLNALQTADLLGASESVAALDAELAIQMFLDASEQKAARFRASSSSFPPKSLQKESAPAGNPSKRVSMPGNVFAAAK